MMPISDRCERFGVVKSVLFSVGMVVAGFGIAALIGFAFQG